LGKNIFKYFKLFILGLISSLIIIQPNSFAKNFEDYFQQGNSMLVLGNFEKAIFYYNKSIAKKPNTPEAYLGLGVAYKELKQYEKAEQATLHSIKLRSNYYQAYYNLGMIYEKQGKYNEAISAFKIFQENVENADVYSDVKQRIDELQQK